MVHIYLGRSIIYINIVAGLYFLPRLSMADNAQDQVREICINVVSGLIRLLRCPSYVWKSEIV